jgi:hypothetical protein
MRSCIGGCQVWETRAGKSRGAQIRLAGPTFPRGGGTTNPIILIYNCYICILLIKTKLIIYMCHIFFKGGVEICELTVRDSGHDSKHVVGDDNVALLDVAEGGTVRERQRKSHGNDLGVVATGAGLPRS